MSTARIVYCHLQNNMVEKKKTIYRKINKVSTTLMGLFVYTLQNTINIVYIFNSLYQKNLKLKYTEVTSW